MYWDNSIQTWQKAAFGQGSQCFKVIVLFWFNLLLNFSEKEERLAKEREEEAKNPEKKKVNLGYFI